MIFSLNELFDLVVMILAVGYIFKDSYHMKAPDPEYDPMRKAARFDLESFKMAVIVTAPAIAMHEMSHKLVALASGVPATFHADYFWLSIGVILKIISFPVLFFVPGYVEHTSATAIQSFMIAFAGPAMNLILWLGSMAVLRSNKKLKPKTVHILHMTEQINMFLFIFNMIPVAPFDGGTVFSSLLKIFFG